MFINLRLISIAVVASIVASADCGLPKFPDGKYLLHQEGDGIISEFSGQEESAFDEYGDLQKADVDEEALAKRTKAIRNATTRDGGESVRRSADEVNPVVIPEGLEHLK